MADLQTPSFILLLMCCTLFVVCYGDSSKPPGSLKPLWNATVTDRLKHELLLHYDKFARPAQHYNTTTVNVGLTIRHLDLNEQRSTFSVNSWIRLMWKDEKLKWNASDYEGMSKLHLADHEIWQPDIVLYNSASGSTVDHYANTHCITHDDGTVLWVPPAQFVVFCELNFLLWPFDTQQCHLQLGSWTYHGYEVDLQLDKDTQNASVDLLVQNSEWELLGVTQERHVKMYKCCSEPYIDVTFNITMKRRSPTYKAIIITPAFAIIIMTLLNFWLPPQAGEKILLNGCTAVIICIFMLYFNQKCPIMGDHTPLIVLFYSSSLYVVSFCMIGSVAVLWLSRTQHHRSLPWMIKHPLTGWLGRWLGLGNYITQTTLSSGRATAEEMRDQQHVFDDQHSGDEHHIITPPQRTAPCQHDWVLLAAAIDRISFVFYSLLFAILAIAYSV